MTDGHDALERQLLTLGRQERELEEALRHLRSAGQDAAAAGDGAEAEAAWDLYERSRARLSALQKEIAALELRGYALRRRQRG